MDDDVMDQQKLAIAAMSLAKALAHKEDKPYDPSVSHSLPTYPLHIAQQIMTRSDAIRELDRLNIFSITSDADVRASSVPMQYAFREICAELDFEKHLEGTLQRIADIESLRQTGEFTSRDLVLGGRCEIQQKRKDTTIKLNKVEKEG